MRSHRVTFLRDMVSGEQQASGRRVPVYVVDMLDMPGFDGARLRHRSEFRQRQRQQRLLQLLRTSLLLRWGWSCYWQFRQE